MRFDTFMVLWSAFWIGAFIYTHVPYKEKRTIIVNNQMSEVMVRREWRQGYVDAGFRQIEQAKK